MKISIIIAALNEGDEVVKTIEGIYKTANPDDFEIILFNDGSKEWVEIPGRRKEMRVFHHKNRMGLPFCRDEGAKLAKYDNLAFFNARMRFYDKRWLPKMLELLKKEPRTLYCTTSVIEWKGKKPQDIPDKVYGAKIRYTTKIKKGINILQPVWIKEKPKEKISDIDCVIGGNYFINKWYYNYIRGFKGFASYGGAEAFLSLKAKMAGGFVKLVRDIEIGNVYRKVKPYNDVWEDFLWNKIYTAFTLLDIKTANELFYEIYEHNLNAVIANRLLYNLDELIKDRHYYNMIKVNNINNLITKNK